MRVGNFQYIQPQETRHNVQHTKLKQKKRKLFKSRGTTTTFTDSNNNKYKKQEKKMI